MARREDILLRKNSILSIAIDEYIKTVTPVSSQKIASTYPDDVSSATVRNILAELEEEGLLTHPHTSAGRIPTEKGYRYYVDYLMNEIHYLEDEKNTLKEQYELQSLQLEALLEKTSKELSDRTRYTSIISMDGWGNKLIYQGTNLVISYSQLQDLQKIQNILAALDEKAKLLEVINRELAKKVEILIGEEIKYTNINNCSLVISGFQTKSGSSGRMAILGPTCMDYKRVVSTLSYFTNMMEEVS